MDSTGKVIPPGSSDPEALQHLPSLREPLGWRELPTPDLEERVMTLMQVSAKATPAIETTPVPTEKTDERVSAEWSTPEHAKSPAWLAGLSGLPWLVFLAGIILVVPVLIWAPLIGGLCVGALVLQSGLMRQWVRRQSALNLDTDFSRQAADAPVRASLKAVEALPTRVRFKHSGWLLAAALFLLAVQAAMLIVVLQLKMQESASAWTNRSATPSPSTPQESGFVNPLVKAKTQTAEDTEQRK